MEDPKTYIVVLNWNGWKDTIECLESVFRLKYDNFAVLVCDNASQDRSLERIAEWADGRQPAECENRALQYLTDPPCSKPIPFLTIEPAMQPNLQRRSERLFLVQTGANLGFAGGNNVGLRLALAAGDFDYVWLLNNDTVVDPNTLSSMIERMNVRPDAGICGSTLMEYHQPQTVQALGGSVYNQWTARGGHIGVGLDRSQLPSGERVEHRMKYVVGASMLVRKVFLEQVGLLSDDYFLYFEELDWAIRAAGKFTLAYSPESFVYHKEGSSIGTGLRAKRSTLSAFYSTRNRVLVTRKYFPYAIISACAAILLSAGHALVFRKGKNSVALLRGLISGFRGGSPNATI